MDGEPSGQPPWEEYHEYLSLIARIQLGPKLRCKLNPSDVVQDTLLKAYQTLPKYEGGTEAEFRAWLRAILANTLKDHARAFFGRKRNINQERSFEAAIDQSSARVEQWIANSSDGPEARMMKEELLDQVARSLKCLLENQRTAIELFFFHEYTVAQIAQEMGLSKSAVGGLIERGVKALRKRMNDAS
jgi:RNA polymerase sigma-70 factor (ECF subfamily)